MRRAIVVGILVAMLVAAVAGTAMAQGRGGSDEATFNFRGSVVETGSDYVVVAVEKGNKKGRAFEGQEVSFAVNEDTRVERDDTPIAITELASDEEVRVQSKAPRDATEFTARKVDVKDD